MLRSGSRVLHWPFALPATHHAAARDWLFDGIQQLGLTVELESWPTLSGHDADELARFDLLFVGGGNTFSLLHHVREYGFVEPVRRFVADGGNYYGGSAGAILACDDIAIAERHDPNEPGLTDLRALGLVRGIAILPHYTTDQEAKARKWAADKGIRLIGLPETSALIVSGDTLQAVGQIYTFTRSAPRSAPRHR
jgi:dipeptidase E